MIRIQVPSQCPHYHRTILALTISLSLSVGNTIATDKLDMSFIQGGTDINPEVWATLNNYYTPGRYLVDLSLNGKSLGKQILDITLQDSNILCLKESWLIKAGINLSNDYFRDNYDEERKCYLLANAPAAKVDFDITTQSLALSIPQKGLVKSQKNMDWDYGANAFRMNYNVNANTGHYNTTLFSSAELKANMGRWVVSSSATASSYDNSATINMFTATRAIQLLSADLAVGKTSTGDSMLGSTGTYGASLSRNNSMKPGNIGYTPVFSGIANSPSRVTLNQTGRLLYSEMVPPGPFSITDVSLYSSGDVTMQVTGEDGRVYVQHFPLSVINGQLNPGQNEFSVAAGVPDDNSSLEGGVFAASYGYGLNDLTLRTGGVFNQDLLGTSAGMVIGLRNLGGISADSAYIKAKYRDGSHSDVKIQLAWSKQLEMTKTGLRVSWSRQGKEYADLSSFDPTDMWEQSNQGRKIKDEWIWGISQPVGGMNLSVSGWQRSHYSNNVISSNRYSSGNVKERGLTGTISSQINGINMNIGLSGSRNSQGDNNWSTSASISVPFTIFERRYSSNTTVSTNKNGGTGFSSGVSGSLNDRFNYGFGGGGNREGDSSSYFNASYSSNQAYLSGGLNHSSNSGASGSVSASGSVLVLPAARNLMFSRTNQDTVAVVNVNGTPGVRVNNGHGETNRDGNLVVGLTSYSQNTVTIDAGTLPLDMEISTTSQKVIPTNQAVVWMSFEALKIRRYLLQVKHHNGKFVSGGTWARDNNDTPLGFVANNGLLMINAVDDLGDITLGECHIPAVKLQNTDKLQEIMCE